MFFGGVSKWRKNDELLRAARLHWPRPSRTLSALLLLLLLLRARREVVARALVVVVVYGCVVLLSTAYITIEPSSIELVSNCERTLGLLGCARKKIRDQAK